VGQKMKSTKWIFAGTLGFCVLAGSFARGQGNGHGNGKGKDNEKHEDKADRKESGHDKHYDKDHDRRVARGWYSEHQGHLPPGLAKRDQLPPGLQRQLVVRGTLPPGLQKHLQPVPEDLEVRLTAPPPECAHVLIGGNIVLLNRRTNLVVDIVAFN
jgi:hypothetical protein